MSTLDVVEPTTECVGTAIFVSDDTGSRDGMAALFTELARRGWRCIAVDLPDDIAGENSLVALIDELDGPNLVGLSRGGLVVQSAIEQGARPASVTLLCASLPGNRPASQFTAEVAEAIPSSLRLLVAHGTPNGATVSVLDEFWLTQSGFGPARAGHNPPVAASLVLPSDASAARVARAHVATLTDSDAAALVVTELVANALTHGTGPFQLAVELTDDAIVIRVQDSDPRSIPMELTTNELDLTGRGLTLINAMSTDWGWQRDAHGKTVWATLPLTAA